MQLRTFSQILMLIVTIGAVMSLLMLTWSFRTQPHTSSVNAPRIVRVQRPSGQVASGAARSVTPQVRVGTPELVPMPLPPQRYTYQNEFPADRTKFRPLYITDTQTGSVIRLGDDTGAAVFGIQDGEHLLWHFICGPDCSKFQGGLYAYTFATQENRFISGSSTPFIHPKLSEHWVAFGHYAPKEPRATLFAANLQTHEIITLTQEMEAIEAAGNGHFGISSRLAAWYTYANPPQIVVYDLAARAVITTFTDYATARGSRNPIVFSLSPGETVVTWSSNWGYDLVTGAYFQIPTLYPPDWDGQPSTSVTPITEVGRVLSWTFRMQDGTHRLIKAPLLDATPSAAPCSEGQNLVQNGDLEDIAAHNLWQQSGSPSDLIVNDLPPNAPQAGQWAIRLGRYSNSQQTIQQTLNIPSNVKRITLAFDVRASSWDIWGGDRLQVDLVDPLTNQSVLAAPVAWTNRQLANGSQPPLQVDIQDWPGIDTPLQLVFRATTDWAFPTDFTLDNLRFLTACH